MPYYARLNSNMICSRTGRQSGTCQVSHCAVLNNESPVVLSSLVMVLSVFIRFFVGSLS